jgi:heme-degrading monooxygenase HmoA
MAEVYTSGIWEPNPGEEEQFLAAWTEFARWGSGLEGAGPFRLMRDLREEGRFVSMVPWASMEAVEAWKGSPDFKRHMSRVQQHVDKFSPTELEVVTTVEKGVVEPG